MDDGSGINFTEKNMFITSMIHTCITVNLKPHQYYESTLKSLPSVW